MLLAQRLLGSLAMGHMDVIFKALLKTRPGDLLAPIPDIPSGPFRLRDTEVTWPQQAEWPQPPWPKQNHALDGLIEPLHDPTGPLIHVEFEAAPRSNTGRRVFQHFAQAHLAAPSRSLRALVYYLTPGKQRRRPAVHYLIRYDHRPQCRLRFDTICLWELQADALLAQDRPGLWAVVPLTAGATPDHVRRAREKIDIALANQDGHRELIAILYAIAGLRFDRDQLTLLSTEDELMHSWVVQDIFDKGRLKGRQEGELKGRQEGELKGRQEGLRGACRRTIALRLGIMPPDIDRLLATLDDEGLLLDLVGQLAAARSVPAVRQVLAQLEQRAAPRQ